MSKLKVDNRVKVTQRNPWVSVGEKGTVSSEGSMPFVSFDNGDGFYMYEERMELINPTSKNQIHITTKDTTTIAVLTDGKKEIRRAVAKCSPSDKYDFEVEANLAFARLMGMEEKKEEAVPPISFDWESFKQGKIAVNCDSQDKATEFLKECEQQDIKWQSEESATCCNYGAMEYTCMFNNRLTYAHIGYNREKGLPIINYPFQPQYKEVKRVAKVGDYIKLTSIGFCHNKIGDVLLVTDTYDNDRIAQVKNENHPRGGGDVGSEYLWNYSSSEYVVLENYTPSIPTPSEPKPIDLSTLSDTELIAELQRRLEKRG